MAAALLEFLPEDLAIPVDFLAFGDGALTDQVTALASADVFLVTRDGKAALVQQAFETVALLALPPTNETPLWIVRDLDVCEAVELEDGHFVLHGPVKRSSGLWVYTRQGRLVQALQTYSQTAVISSVSGHVALGQPTDDNTSWRFVSFGATAPLVEQKENALLLPRQSWYLQMVSVGCGVWRDIEALRTESMLRFSPRGELNHVRVPVSLMKNPRLVKFLTDSHCIVVDAKKVVQANIMRHRPNHFRLQKTDELSLPVARELPMAFAFFDGILHIVGGPSHQAGDQSEPNYVLRPNHRHSRLRLPSQYRRAQFVVHGRNLYLTATSRRAEGPDSWFWHLFEIQEDACREIFKTPFRTFETGTLHSVKGGEKLKKRIGDPHPLSALLVSFFGGAFLIE